MAADNPESLRKRAWVIYNADIKHLVEPEHKNNYLVLNVDTGDYEIDARLGQASARMLERFQILGTKNRPSLPSASDTRRLSTDGPRIKGTPISPEEWAEQLARTGPCHLRR